MMMTAPACAQETIPVVLDSVKTDTVVKSAPRKLGLIRRIIRGFDKVDERYIEWVRMPDGDGCSWAIRSRWKTCR